MHFDILSLFPEYFQGPFSTSIVRRALERDLISISLTNIRDFAKGRHQQVDDRPYGGGPGMVLSAGPLVEAIESVRDRDAYVVYLSPQGKLLDHKMCRRLAEKKHLVLVCGHYEGIDERVIHQEIDEEISIGDYVLTNGCVAAIVILDSIIRFIPKVLGNEESAKQDSFEKREIFEGPQFTRPFIFRGEAVPEVLVSGNHQEIEKYRREKALEKSYQNRGALWQKKDFVVEGKEKLS